MKTYTQDELSNILELHRWFLKNDPSGVPANLVYTDLKEANLKNVDLKEADLEGANLDYSCWPLWCGSFDVEVDIRIAAQLAYHFCRLDCDDPEYVKARNSIVKFANTFHLVGESGIPEVEEI